jgi:hypothetical protein
MVYYAAAAASVIMGGPTGILVSLGIETFITDINTVYVLYNYLAVGLLLFIASMSGSRGEAKYCIIVPIFAGIFILFGWLRGPDPIQTWAMTIICGLLGVMIYMNETNHERYGTAGPGSKLINIVFYIILFQACIGLVNGFNLFPIGPTQATPNMCNINGMPCNSLHNIDITQSVNSMTGTGGLLDDVAALITVLGQMAVATFRLLINIAASILLFAVVINATVNGIFPGIISNPMYMGFLVVLQIANWAMLGLFLFNLSNKPMPQEGSI